ncbi:hypothetical protein BS47DRAFT_1077616 [Hydnum rufescens UP504]|uniref:Uncharacterized protein n=1 Tax=Hydnum rufescens UP504 TaxID=1448309 RepID=A0A9P6B8U5_9AGAM|nr:hypothetical protein BS47DRAFT_1077616 [Hydnum rufescens UP504]
MEGGRGGPSPLWVWRTFALLQRTPALIQIGCAAFPQGRPPVHISPHGEEKTSCQASLEPISTPISNQSRAEDTMSVLHVGKTRRYGRTTIEVRARSQREECLI